MKYVFYQIGVDDSDLDRVDVREEFGMERLKKLPERHRQHMVELFRIMADSLETDIIREKFAKQRIRHKRRRRIAE